MGKFPDVIIEVSTFDLDVFHHNFSWPQRVTSCLIYSLNFISITVWNVSFFFNIKKRSS